MRVPLVSTVASAARPGRPREHGAARPLGRVALAAVIVVLTATVWGTGAGAQTDPTVAPITTLSPDGRTGTDGTRTMALSQVVDLDPAGSTVSASGSGYDENKGVYVALCVIPPKNYVPSPCGGGVDTEGTQGASQWISSNPPSYGVGLAQPYGPGGSFVTSFTVRAEIAPGIDCRQVRCALVTRSDHTRTSDRSQDIIIPVTFRAAAPVTTAPPTPGRGPTTTEPALGGVVPPPTTPVPTVTVPPLANPTTTVPAPAATVADDGLSTTDGARTLAVNQAALLDPVRQSVSVTGTGFDETRGIYVSLCAVPAAGGAPGPCRTGSPEANRWVSSNPPEYGVGIATPFGAGGAFAVELAVEPVVDTATDCRLVACAVVTRADDTNPDDRTLDLVIPVSFAEAGAGTSLPPATSAPQDDAGTDDGAETDAASSVTIDDSSSTGPLLAIVAVVIVLAVLGAGIAASRRRAPADGGPSSIDPSTPADGPGAPPGSGPPSDPSAGGPTGGGTP